MFGKKQNGIETLIGKETSASGTMTVKGSIRIDGVVEGDIKADWIIVGTTGHVKGDVEARGAVIGGKIYGDISSSEVTELLDTCEVYGDIHTTRLIIAEGAVFRGHSFMESSDNERKNVVTPLLSETKE